LIVRFGEVVDSIWMIVGNEDAKALSFASPDKSHKRVRAPGYVCSRIRYYVIDWKHFSYKESPGARTCPRIFANPNNAAEEVGGVLVTISVIENGIQF
jgi:hypothetical protein